MRVPHSCLAMAIAVSTACAPVPVTEPAAVIRLTTGTPGAGFYPLGESLARVYADALPQAEVQVRESAGSVSNVEAIERGDADIGFAFADVVYMGFSGGLTRPSRALEHLRGIAVIQLTPLHLVVRRDSGIRKAADLRGRRVGLGPPGSGTALTAALVLQAFGLAAEDVRAEALLFNEAGRRLIEGRLDAMFVDASYPADSVRDAARAGALLVPLEGPAIESLRIAYPFFRQTLIPAETYPGHSSSVHTIGVDSVLVCRNTLSEAMVYELTRTFFDALPTLAAEQPSLRLMDLEQAAATPVPLHAGAARYYRERELFR